MRFFFFQLLMLFFQLDTFSTPTQSIRIKNGEGAIMYLKTEPGGATETTRTVKLDLDYWSTENSNNAAQKVSFIIDPTSGLTSAPSITMNDVEIEGKEFSKDHKTLTVEVSVKITAISSYAEESFDILLKDLSNNHAITALTGGNLHVKIVKEMKATTPDSLSVPAEFTYLNAVNFDFENSTGAGYVGHLNVFKPELLRSRKNPKGTRYYGLNCGIMKINYSKTNDSLVNNSFNYNEIVKVNPLDSIKTGMPFHRQYNNFKNVSKNVSWSFYFQPTYTLMNQDNIKIMVHLHAEFFVNTWNTTTTIHRIQQVTDTITASNIGIVRDSIYTLDKFYKQSTDMVTSQSSTTKLIFFAGAGVTLSAIVWKGGHLFVQPTFGLATNYLSVDNLVKQDLGKPVRPDEKAAIEKRNSWFHLSRFELKQDLTASIQGVVGVNVRGRFGQDPSYAAYVGATVGWEGIKNLFNKK